MGYAGWVHARREIEGWGREDEYFDTVSGTWVSAMWGPQGLLVRMYVPTEQKEVTYDSTDKVVRVREMDEAFAAERAAAVRGRALTAEWLLAEMPGVTVTRVREGDLDRYESSTEETDGEAWGDGHRPLPRVEGITWADARTGLVRRSDARIGGMRVTCQYRYGGPAVRDVFEVGVPRDTRVVDERPYQ